MGLYTALIGLQMGDLGRRREGVKSALVGGFSEERPVRWGRRGYPQLAVPSGKTGLTFVSLRLRPHGVISGPHRAAEGGLR